MRPGETVGITGRTGSGKSTVLQLAMRMMDPTDGSVVLDGTPLPSWELEALRNHLGYVPQDVFLFSDTIGNNIAFGVRDNEPSSAGFSKLPKMQVWPMTSVLSNVVLTPCWENVA